MRPKVYARVVFVALLLTNVTDRDGEQEDHGSIETTATPATLSTSTTPAPTLSASIEVPGRQCTSTSEGRDVENDTEVDVTVRLRQQNAIQTPLATCQPPLQDLGDNKEREANCALSADGRGDVVLFPEAHVRRLIQLVEWMIIWTEEDWWTRFVEVIRSPSDDHEIKKQNLLNLHGELSGHTDELLATLRQELSPPVNVDGCDLALLVRFLDDLDRMMAWLRGTARWLSHEFFSPAVTHDCDAQALENLRRAALPPPNWLERFDTWRRSFLNDVNASNSENTDSSDPSCGTPPRKIRRENTAPERPRKLFSGSRLEYLQKLQPSGSSSESESQISNKSQSHKQGRIKYFVAVADTTRQPYLQQETENIKASLGAVPAGQKEETFEAMEGSWQDVEVLPAQDVAGSPNVEDEARHASPVPVEPRSHVYQNLSDVIRESFEVVRRHAAQEIPSSPENIQLSPDEPMEVHFPRTPTPSVAHITSQISLLLVLIPTAVVA